MSVEPGASDHRNSVLFLLDRCLFDVKGGARSKELLLFIVNRNPTVLFLNPNKDHSLRSDTRHQSDELAAGRKLKCAAVT